MENTKLLYLEDMGSLTSPAKVIDVIEEEGKTAIVLDQTIFYPQGGGQPYDQGQIISPNGTFNVLETRYFDGIVRHIGSFEKGTIAKGEAVTLQVDSERRKLNARIHSAGHLVDMAMYELRPDWIPGKGYHFPEGPYVEYTGKIAEEEKDTLMHELEAVMADKISKQIPVSIVFAPKDELSKYCRHVPENIPEGKPTRLVLFGDFGVPCGGTHVGNLSEIVSETVRKIKGSDTIRVSYDVSR